MAAPDTSANRAGAVLEQCVRFGRMLRRAGVPVTPAQLVDLAHALAFVDVSNKEDFRLSAQAILVNRPEHLAIFATVFKRFWRRPAPEQPDMPPTVRWRTDDAVATWQVDTLDLHADDTPHIDRTARYSAVERLRQYRSAVVTAEAMIWHHGYKGLDAALKAIEAEPEDFREKVRADLVARLAADRYQRFKQADVFERALLLELWSRRRGQMIRA